MEQLDSLTLALAGIPHMTPEQGQAITDFICEHELRHCLELGFAHGVGTAYITRAVQALGSGSVTAIDLEAARQRQPDIYTTLNRAGIDSATVEIYFEPSCYTWRLMKFLEAGRAGTFDFIYLDGAHAWLPDGFAFLLGKRLLRPGGWILFDDINWTFESPTLQRFDFVQRMSAEERHTPQVRKIWDLLVRPDPDFDQLIERDDWAFARKAPESTAPQKIVYRYHPLTDTLLLFKNLARKGLQRARSARRLAS
jgi:predicted O-methyltransferase YrrM